MSSVDDNEIVDEIFIVNNYVNITSVYVHFLHHRSHKQFLNI